MIITPLRPQPPRPVALLTAGLRTLTVTTEDGTTEAHGPQRCWNLLQRYGEHQCYVAGSLRPLLLSTGAKAWTVDLWRGRPTTFYLAGTDVTVSSLRRTLDTCRDPDATYQALSSVIRFVESQGVRAGSLSAMAWALWRSTLSERMDIAASPKLSRRALFGGRQERYGRDDSHFDQVSIDISSAYPHAMATRPYASGLSEVPTSTRRDPYLPGLCEATVVVPDDLPFAPLPIRLGPELIQWRRGTIEGVWSWRELASASLLGCTVTPQRVWAPLRLVQPFDAWWSLLRAARASVPPDATKLVKALTNCLWGCFAMTGEHRGNLTWNDDYGNVPIVSNQRTRHMPQERTAHIAAETTSRVRTRVLLEGLYGSFGQPCHVDTDGLIVDALPTLMQPFTAAPGEWGARTTMHEVQVRAPQLYRYDCGAGCGQQHSKWHYVASGVAPHRAAELFDTHPGFQVSFHGDDHVAPGWSHLDDEQVRRYSSAAKHLEALVYGKGIVNG